MLNILIADQIKSSLVMSSEVFKDKIAGCVIHVAQSGQRVLEIAGSQKIDMVVIDFDLQDTDGVTLALALRHVYSGPILITAYPDKIATDAIRSELFAYNDLSGWIRKPVKFDDLAAKIDAFLFNKQRLLKRFETDIDTILVGKGEGRGKRSPKVSGNIVTLSISGALVKLEAATKLRIGDEITVAMDLPDEGAVAFKVLPKTKTKAKVAKLTGKATVKPSVTLGAKASKVKATVAWINKNKTEAGVQFTELTESQKKKLECVLRAHA